jgi:hypothetical protein
MSYVLCLMSYLNFRPVSEEYEPQQVDGVRL